MVIDIFMFTSTSCSVLHMFMFMSMLHFFNACHCGDVIARFWFSDIRLTKEIKQPNTPRCTSCNYNA